MKKGLALLGFLMVFGAPLRAQNQPFFGGGGGPSVNGSTIAPQSANIAGQLTVGGTVTVKGAALSVGGSNLSVDANQLSTSKPATLGSSLTLTGYAAGPTLSATGGASGVTVASFTAAGTLTTEIITMGRADGAARYHISYNGTDGAEHIGTLTSHPLAFDTNGSEVGRFLSGGNFGIATASPLATLHVAGTQSTTGAATFGSSTTFASGGVEVDSGTTKGSRLSGTFYGSSSTAWPATIANGTCADSTAMTVLGATDNGLMPAAIICQNNLASVGGITFKARVSAASTVIVSACCTAAVSCATNVTATCSVFMFPN